MTHRRLLAGAAVALIGVAGAQAALAQVTPRPDLGTRPAPSPVQTATGERVIGDRIEDLELRTQRELAQAEDQARFGLAGTPPGFGGSVFATGVWASGNTDSVDFGLGGRFTLGQAPINHTFGFAVDYGSSEGERDRNRVLGIYDLNYDLTPQFYAFGLARGQYDEFAPRNEQDFFVGAGPGIRIFNQPELAWRVQAGPGVRYTKNVDDGETDTDLAGIASSRVYYQVTADMFLTNDTDVLHSDVDTLVTNELALNTRLAGPLSARVGLRTDYSTDPAEGQDSTDNRVSFGIVYSFQ